MTRLPRAGAGAFSTHVQYTKQVEAVDPVAQHGAPMSMHPHTFFGALAITADTTPDDLRAAGNALAQGVPDPAGTGPPLPDNSGYWCPALYTTPDRTTLVKPAFALAYYRSGDPPHGAGGVPAVDPHNVEAFDASLGMVGGNRDAMRAGDNPHIGWACVVGTVGVDSPTIPTAWPVANAAGTPYTLRLTVRFPSCIDPTPGGDPYNATSRMCYPVPNPNYGATDPYPLAAPPGYTSIPRLDLVIRYHLEQFPVSGGVYDLSGATLASDYQMGSGGRGVTAHADFMSGWASADLATLVEAGYHADPPRNLGVILGPGNR